MAHSESEPLTRTHIHIYTSDKERLDQLFGGNIGYSRAIRSILRNYLRNIEAKALENAKRPEVTDTIMTDLLKGEENNG